MKFEKINDFADETSKEELLSRIRIALASAAPSTGSVPAPTSSRRTRELFVVSLSMEIKLTKDDIKKSLDAKWRKKHFLMFLIIYVITSLLVFFGVHFYTSNKQVIVDSNLPLGLAEIFMFLVFGSFALYYLVRYILLFKDIDSYEKYEVIDINGRIYTVKEKED